MTEKERITENALSGSTFMMPKEEMLEIRRKGKKIRIGIPSDKDKVEYRVPLTPQAVELLVSYGHDILIEKEAGKAASYSDEDYRTAGALVMDDRKEIFECDIILRVAPFDESEIDMLKGHQALISNLQINAHCPNSISKLMQKKLTTIAYEYLEDEDGMKPIVQLMSQISGSTSVVLINEYMSKSRDGKGVLLGSVTGISPAELVILGSGTAAEFAARAALGLGAIVKVFDDNICSLRKLEEKLPQRIFTSVYYPKVVKKALKSADAVLGAMPVSAPLTFRIAEEMVQKMKPGSVIIDLNVSQGGCFETSRCTDLNNPAFVQHGVVHYCVPNVPAIVARTASIALSNVLIPILISIGEIGGIDNYIKSSKGFRKGVYMYNGILTDSTLSEEFNIPYKDINLLLSVF
ncbi:MAG TPA: alanine dehydrogenase [Prolixibacteraceae bacterium]|nr:alanine dehydrogenase [Prolixibacteraceae bacterium]HPR85570.1 alanine dehydrogenase [Prolixibacteraceae bacterium]